jgi:hypothetical protein
VKINFIIEHTVDVELTKEEISDLLVKNIQRITNMDDFRKIEEKASEVQPRLLAFKVVDEPVN